MKAAAEIATHLSRSLPPPPAHRWISGSACPVNTDLLRVSLARGGTFASRLITHRAVGHERQQEVLKKAASVSFTLVARPRPHSILSRGRATDAANVHPQGPRA